MTRRPAGEPILRVCKSHRWMWRPRTNRKTINGGRALWWLGLYVEYLPYPDVTNHYQCSE